MELFYTGTSTVGTKTHDIIISGERGDNNIKFCIVDRFEDTWERIIMTLEEFEKLYELWNVEYYRMASNETTNLTLFREKSGTFITCKLTEDELDTLLYSMENYVYCML